MNGPEFPWLQPRPILLTPEEFAVWRAYAAEHSRPYLAAVEPSPELRARVLAEIHTVDQVPLIDDDPWRVLDCGHLRGELHPQCLDGAA